MTILRVYISFLYLLFFCNCTWNELIDVIEPAGITVAIPADSIHFAVIGDFGTGNQNAEKVANLVHSLEPDFILTSGDNNYPEGKAETLVHNIGTFYCDFIFNFDAPAAQQCTKNTGQVNRFFPSLGNHDYDNSNGRIPYLNYFTLPGNEIYYDFIWGPVHFFALDSNRDTDTQRIWLEEKLTKSQEAFTIVYFHHPPFSCGTHGNEKKMQWDFEGVDLVITGHDHNYQRITERNTAGPVYLVNGLGGQNKKQCGVNILDSKRFDSFCYDENYGALIIDASELEMHIKFISIENQVIDSFSLQASGK